MSFTMKLQKYREVEIAALLEGSRSGPWCFIGNGEVVEDQVSSETTVDFKERPYWSNKLQLVVDEQVVFGSVVDHVLSVDGVRRPMMNFDILEEYSRLIGFGENWMSCSKWSKGTEILRVVGSCWWFLWKKAGGPLFSGGN